MSDVQQEQKKIPQRPTKEELLSFLMQKGEKHQYFNHYTNISTLTGMLESKKIYLSRADRLNDFNEGGRIEEKRNVFIGSFSCCSPENIAMWSMYATPYQEGICLKIDGKSMRAFLRSFNNNPQLYPTSGNKKDRPISLQGEAKLFMVDVVYVNNDGQLDFYMEKYQESIFGAKQNFKNTPPPSISLFNWCRKDRVWKSENEARLVLELDQPLPDREKIAIDFSNALLDLRITCGPCVDIPKVENALMSKNLYFKKDMIFKSAYYNKTYFKPCKKEDCNRTPFCNNRNP